MVRVTREENRIPGLVATSNDGNDTPVVVWADTTTHRLLVSATAAVTAGDGDVIVVQSKTLPITPQRVAITASASGDNTAISAPVSGSIYVYAFEISFSGSVNSKFTNGASGTNLGGLYYGVANAGAANSVTPPNYLFKCSATTALIINLSGSVAIGGGISYWVA